MFSEFPDSYSFDGSQAFTMKKNNPNLMIKHPGLNKACTEIMLFLHFN